MDDDPRVDVVVVVSWRGTVTPLVSWHTLRLDGRHWRTPIAAWWDWLIFPTTVGFAVVRPLSSG